MKNLLKKLSRTGDVDRRAELEHEAAEHIKAASSQPPSEVTEGPAPVSADADVDAGAAHQRLAPPPGRRLTVQERVAARQLQSQSH